MKIILLKDIPHLGSRYDLKDVPDGYALNFLLPHRLALKATKEVMEEFRVRRQREANEKETRLDLLMLNLKTLHDTVFELSVKANEKGHLFSGIHAADIREAIKRELQMDFPEECIELREPIKQVGEYSVPLMVGERKETIRLVVKPE